MRSMRRKTGKGGVLLLFGALLTILGAMTAMADSTVRIRIDHDSRSNWTEDVREPKVTVNYTQVSPDWSKPVEEWVPGKKVTGMLNFDGSYTRSGFSIYGGTLASVSEKDGETTVKLSYVPVARLGSPAQAGWSDAMRTKAVWKKVPYASRYQLRLYQENQWIKTMVTNATSMDLVDSLRDGLSYYYEVRAVARDKSESAYLEDGDFTVSDNSVVQELGDTMGRWSSTPTGKRYSDDSGNYVSGGWKMISGKWYYFNQDGYDVTGWQSVAGKWYYMDGNGIMLTGWQLIGGKWYYLYDGGDMAVGWVQSEPGRWYYLNDDGSMAADTVIDGKYHLDSSGQWVP